MKYGTGWHLYEGSWLAGHNMTNCTISDWIRTGDKWLGTIATTTPLLTKSNTQHTCLLCTNDQARDEATFIHSFIPPSSPRPPWLLYMSSIGGDCMMFCNKLIYNSHTWALPVSVWFKTESWRMEVQSLQNG